MMKIWVLVMALSLLSSDAYKILNVFPVITRSHDILGAGINRHLLSAGHEVTYVTPYPDKDPHPNLRIIDVSKNLDLIPKDKLNMSSLQGPSLYHELVMIGMHMLSCMTLENENFQQLLNNTNEHFDLVIVDWLYSDIIWNGVAHFYNAPLAWVSTVDPHWAIISYVDDPPNPAYNGDVLSGNIVPFTFGQRVQELWLQIRVSFYINFIAYYFDGAAYRRILSPHLKTRGREPAKLEDLSRNASLVIGNSHISFGEAIRLPQNYITVGGYHVEDKVKPLPEDLQKILDNAKNGVIYFSMGSIIQSKDLSREVKQSLIKMFGALKHTVLWKFEDQLNDLPNNVYIVKWAPQQSILAHPNCILFITHGGLLSTTETIHFGVPIIGVPIFADQFANIDKAVNRGFALKVEFKSSILHADELKLAIEEMLGNPKYSQKVKELSFIYHDRLLKPGAEIIFWVEHVIKTRGAPKLRSIALMVPWYQKFYIDFIALVIAIVLIVKNTLRILFRGGSKPKTD